MKLIGQRSLSSFIGRLIDVGWYGTIVLLALFACVLVVAPWVDPPRIEVGLAVPVTFSVDADTRDVTTSTRDAERVHLDNASGSLKFSPRSSLLVAGSAVFVIAALGVLLWVFGLLRAVFRTLRAGQPFVAANATRIRRIAYAVIFCEASRTVLAYLGMRYVKTTFFIPGITFEARPDLNFVAIICGLIILVIAEVFREGTRLDEEQSLTV